MRRGAGFVLFVLVIVSAMVAPTPAVGASGPTDKVRAVACAALRDHRLLQAVSGAGERQLHAVCSGTLGATSGGRTATKGAPRDDVVPAADLLLNRRSADTYPKVTQSEAGVAVHDGTVIVGWNDSNASPGFMGYGRSTNGGTTWTDRGQLPQPLGAIGASFGDPVPLADRNRVSGQTSVFYFGTIASSATDGRSIVGVYRSDDGGVNWSFGRNASPLAKTTDKLNDKEWLAVDPRASGTGAGNLYVCWTKFDQNNQGGIQFSVSKDHGLTFTQRSTRLSSKNQNVQSCQIAVNPLNGAVYVSWFDWNTTTPEIHFRASTDQGTTWGSEKVIGQAPRPETQATCGNTTRRVFQDSESNSVTRAIRSAPAPTMVVNPVTGNIDAVWHRATLSGGSLSDLAFSRSVDGGATWSTPTRINSQVTGQQFFPALAVNQDAELRVIYYSTQNSSTNRKIDVYEVTSVDGGTTWSIPDRVTDVSFDRPQTNPNFNPPTSPCYMGDYLGNAAAGPGLGDSAFLYAWGDNRLDADPNTSGIQPDPDIRFERRAATASSGGVSGDFNGDGNPDLAVGVPGEGILTVNKQAEDIGAVHVLYSNGSGLSSTGNQEWTQDSSGVPDSAEFGDRFGSAVAAGDFNNDGFDDLAVGVPDEDILAATDGGAVNVIYGGAGGLQTSSPAAQLWSQSTSDVEDASESGDRFGAALAAADFNGDGFADLAIGAPGEDIAPAVSGAAPAADAGAVNVIYGSGFGLSATSTPDQLWFQDSPNIIGSPEAGDGFGSSLAAGDMGAGPQADLAIGAPGEDVGSVPDAGAVSVIYGSGAGLTSTGNQIWDQNESSVNDVSEAGDRFGAAVAVADFGGTTRADLAVGIPGEELAAGIFDSGAVQVFYGSDSGLATSGQQEFDQDTPDGIQGARETGDMFGASLAAGQLSAGPADLAIGAPGEDVGTIVDAGAVNVIYGTSIGLTVSGNQIWDQDEPNVDGQAEAQDLFGVSLTIPSAGRSWLAVGVPWESIGTVQRAGAVNVIYGGSSGLQTTSPIDQVWDQDSSNVPDQTEPGDAFGAAVG